jgi:hypothetical protein
LIGKQIQYSSPSEHQWKFPLVRELSRAIVAAERVFGASFPFQHTTFRHGKDDTLVIYHRSQRHVMESLRPHRSAQALHPMPFLDEASDEARLSSAREQVFNSAFNGLTLGYPERFVRSYCEGLVGDVLSLDEKMRQFQLAVEAFREQFGPTREIALGLQEPIAEEHLAFIRAQLRMTMHA